MVKGKQTAIFVNGILQVEGHDYDLLFGYPEFKFKDGLAEDDIISIIEYAGEDVLVYGHKRTAIQGLEEFLNLCLKGKRRSKQQLKQAILQSRLDNFEKIKLLRKYKLDNTKRRLQR